MMTSTYESPDADCCAVPVEVPDVLEVVLPGALVLPLVVELLVLLELLPGAFEVPLLVEPEVVPVVLLVVPDDLFPEDDEVPLLTGAVSPSALLEENPSPTMPGPFVAATRSVL